MSFGSFSFAVDPHSPQITTAQANEVATGDGAKKIFSQLFIK